jgi:nitrite reductase/ring-hydroxylating ferredoxin subunit
VTDRVEATADQVETTGDSPASPRGMDIEGTEPVGVWPPLPYPAGWFHLADLRELKPGTVLRRRLMDEDVVVYRTRSGTVCAVRPYCPHLGAHLGVGGTVAGENLVCPFHHFAFAPDGCFAGGPDGAVIRGRVEHYAVRQHHGMVFVWHGHDDAAPAWELPEITDACLVPTARWTTTVATHPQELAENGADFRHLPVLHGIHAVEEAPCEAAGPLFRVHLRSAERGRFKYLPGTQSILLAGLGYSHVEFAIPQLEATVRIWWLLTPTGPWQTRVHLVTACETSGGVRVRLLGRALAYAALWGTIRVFRQDIPIWTHKRYEPRPRLARGDEVLSRFRRWTHQFYPAGS